ncbi:protein CHROMOSOME TRANSMISSION FIDELITY 7 isoform X2 [Cynara cardunculus var. scolymus]|uniref:protein CHROMOSOME TRANSMISSION FIDELITY 7 isoform X2 n=1 Tax=Cynara cardunculus var. scolymus TaxID=59895 RepID=UPI000D625C01|nr:protein CHROMOSOME TRANSMISSION FIDELITY 7 isoform X2 [Cynara cardunculus var. scolymus]
MQLKINSFFKSSSPSTVQRETLDLPLSPLEDLSNEVDFTKEPEIPIIYTRRAPNSDRRDDGEWTGKDPKKLDSRRPLVVVKSEKFAPGDEGDEKAHKEFHKNYTHGIGFKGWRNERVIDMLSLECGRVILVLKDDPPAHSKKVKEVIGMMETELGDGWIFHEQCKVYLFICSQRVAGCLVAESINKAYQLVSNSDEKSDVTTAPEEDRRLTSTTLKFGGVSFQREIVTKNPLAKNERKANDDLLGAIICEKDAVPAVCGIRAIWVTPSNRRKHIATHLLEATRKSFCPGLSLEHRQLAFSQPTNVGKLLASSYTNTKSILVYTTNS